MTTTVRIETQTRDKLKLLSKLEKKPMHVILDQAIEDYRRKNFLEEANRAYASLKEDSKAWQAEQKERLEWDVTLNDGFERE